MSHIGKLVVTILMQLFTSAEVLFDTVWKTLRLPRIFEIPFYTDTIFEIVDCNKFRFFSHKFKSFSGKTGEINLKFEFDAIPHTLADSLDFGYLDSKKWITSH